MAEQSLLLCRYRYDPLDRLASIVPPGDDAARFFYRRNRLVTQIKGAMRSTILHAGDQPLAQHQVIGGTLSATLLGTEHPCSVLHALGTHQSQSWVYTVYGHASAGSGLASLLGFNGERRDPLIGHYLLGNGYRAFNPVLMRFNSPDSLSPFGAGGFNAYAYCAGNPVDRRDPGGHMWSAGKGPRPSGSGARTVQAVSGVSRQRPGARTGRMPESSSVVSAPVANEQMFIDISEAIAKVDPEYWAYAKAWPESTGYMNSPITPAGHQWRRPGIVLKRQAMRKLTDALIRSRETLNAPAEFSTYPVAEKRLRLFDEIIEGFKAREGHFSVKHQVSRLRSVSKQLMTAELDLAILEKRVMDRFGMDVLPDRSLRLQI